MFGRKKILVFSLLMASLFVLNGCANKQQAAPQETLVKTMQVVKRDTPITYEYSSFVEAQKEIQLKARVSGMIVEKHFNGGDYVEKGQLLYVIDPRSYQAASLNAQAQLANAEAVASNTRRDAERYQTLYEQGAISKQVYDNTMASLAQSEAQVAAQQALLSAAQVDVGETNVVAPFSGRISTEDVAIGTFVTSGQTVLGTISNSDPVLVKFNISETEYLKVMTSAKGSASSPLENISLKLADGVSYPYNGKLTQVDRGISEGTGTLTLKAEFPNPDNLLLPGMFANLQANIGTKKDALLVPQRAVSEIMYKYFVYVVDEDNKVEMKEVKLGARVGRMWVVEEGLDGSENIIVEGTQKVKTGSVVKPEKMTEEELDNSTAQ
ncbi:MAG TPA: efflux RND transporter periplasmic adaptor subunit [Candidatus Avacidaminococcus intestinavium]|uniref:Efflux RND transporter periplasmic adaptor subunit n=1 Tax=Candidatus Avacidaminococcus intestinavium TaxID=2840684 RepID=A0A9D1SL88_9FIRM|nr:efflux RND transporter periplasmic adaptor subunit [Candidatus Avacidaminococcus intestinavium]